NCDPTIAPAPGRFSMTIDCPSRSRMRSAMKRATTSLLPPAAYGTISLMRGLGWSLCARAGHGVGSAPSRPRLARRVSSLTIVILPIPVFCRLQGARRYFSAFEHGCRFRLEQAKTARNRPPHVVGAMDDQAFEAARHQVALVGMAKRDVRDLLGQPDCDANVGAVDWMAQRRRTGLRFVRFPSLAVRGIEFPGLSAI